MTLTHDTPAGKLVYDATPEITYDPSRVIMTGGMALPPRPQVQSPREESPLPPSPGSAPRGFGQVTTRRMLDMGPPAKHPWLTVELAREELAMHQTAVDGVAATEAALT